ncbi:unnamed protein product [Musa textilis]
MSNPVLRLRQWGLTGHCATTLASGGAEGLKHRERERERAIRCSPRFAAFFMVGSHGSSKTLMERGNYIRTRRTDRRFQTTPPSLETRKKGESVESVLLCPRRLRPSPMAMLRTTVDRLTKSGVLRAQGLVGGNWIDAYDGMTVQLGANSLQVTGASV